MPESPNQWQIIPQGTFSRHFDLSRGGEPIASLKMSFWTEGCDFAIAGHEFAIRRASAWVDGFHLFSGNESVCEVKRGLWSRRFDLITTLDGLHERWALQRAGWFTRNYQLLAGTHEVGQHVVGTVRSTSWFNRRRVADFADDVPLPIQVLSIFLVLLVSQRQQKRNAPGPGI